MDAVMNNPASNTACHSRGSRSSSPKPAPHDGNDILLDTFFDHSQQLDSTAFDALLDTSFDAADDATTSTSTSTSTVKATRRPSHTEENLQQQALPARSNMAVFNTGNDMAMQTSSPDYAFTTATSHARGFPAPSTSTYHTLPAHAYQTNMYEQSNMTQPLPMRFNPLRHQLDHEHQYPGPSGMPHMSDFAPTMIPHQHQQHQQQLPFHPAHHIEPHQPTADLLDYDNSIPEEDGIDENANGEVADPCYAQLLYRCLLEAPDHTMSLKDVYSWVCRHSQKARDASGTGWQNSVRHNLSMNAAFERATASTAHGGKKGSLWRLTDRALQEGVISTTRYRKDPKRKPERRSSPAIKRQLSGAKGGQATRAASAHRRAMQARASGAQNYSGIERHRRAGRKQEATYFPPTSMPAAAAAPLPPPPAQPGWFPHNMPPPPVPQPMSQAPSPYFLHPMEEDAFSTITHPTLSNPHTPNEVQVGFEGAAKPMMGSPTGFGSPSRESRGFLTEFELSHLDHETRSLFGNHDEFMPDTPSLATEGSFMSEEMTPMTMDRLSVEPMRS